MTWSATQYVAFEDERTRPVRDLLAAVPAIAARSVIDLGCGPGNSTALLKQRFPEAVVSGLDSSPEMLEAARTRLPGVTFELGDISEFAEREAPSPGEKFDVILANAVLQWVPDHARLIPALMAMGGVLAVQMPDNFAEPSHVLMREIAGDGPWAGRLAGVEGRTSIAAADWYYSLVRAAGGNADVWRTTYHHPLEGGAAAIVEWFKGSALRPYLAPLDAGERARFLARYEAAVAGAYPALSDGTVLLPFPRLFIVAVR